MTCVRLIAVSLLALAGLACSTTAPSTTDKDAWITLFNGKDLTGWDGDPSIWRVENGYISGKVETAKSNSFLIYAHPFSDFVLEAKFQLFKTGKFPNSGIQYRSIVKNPKAWVVNGYQADIGDDWYGTLYEEGGRGVLAKANPDAVKAVKADDWNTYVITAEGTKVKQAINGVTSIELDDTNEKGRKEGILALQYHAPGGFEIRFKDIKIKPAKK